MNKRDLRILQKVSRHIKRHYPEVSIKLIREEKLYYLMGFPIEHILTVGKKKFTRRRDYVRRVHGRKLSKPIIFTFKHKRT